MPKLRVFSSRELRALLSEFGFEVVRQRGSHVVMRKLGENGTITTVVPEHGEVKMGTLRSIIRQTQLPRDVFETD